MVSEPMLAQAEMTRTHSDPGQWTAVLEEPRMCLLGHKRIRNCYFEKLLKKITVAIYRKSEEDRSC